jgi:hypothetical protein
MSAQTRPKSHGTARPTTDVVTFYNETRAKACPATFSAISGVGPLVVFSGPVVLLAGLLAEGSQPDGLKRQFGGAATAKIAVGSG